VYEVFLYIEAAVQDAAVRRCSESGCTYVR
jgi:hypothetical protein